jgi:hypothetical protein
MDNPATLVYNSTNITSKASFRVKSKIEAVILQISITVEGVECLFPPPVETNA